MPLPFLSALERVEPSSDDFLSTLDQFLRSKEEHRLLAQLRRSAAVDVANILDKVRDKPVVTRESWADFRVDGAYTHIFPPRRPQAHHPPPTVTLWVVGGIAHLLHVPRRSGVLGKAPIYLFALRSSVQG